MNPPDYSNSGRTEASEEYDGYADWRILNEDKNAHDESVADAMVMLKIGRRDEYIVSALRKKFGISENLANELLFNAKDYMMDDAVQAYI